MTLRKLLPYSIACLLTALPVLSSCVDGGMADVSLPHEEADGSGVYVSVVVNTEGGVRTRAGSPKPGEDGDGPQAGVGDENRVYDLNVFFFEGEVDENTGERKGINSVDAANIPVKCVYFDGNDLQYVGNNPANHYDAIWSVTKEVNEETGLQIGNTYDVLVVANYGREITLAETINNLADLRDITHHAISESEGAHHFLMSSAGHETNSITIEANNSKNVERVAARVDYYILPEYSIGETGGKVIIKGATLVNKYKDESFVFKRVTKSETISSTTDFIYLGDEIGSGTNVASNYVIDPETSSYSDKEYDFPFQMTDWNDAYWSKESSWVLPSTTITSEDDKFLTYGFLGYTQENVVPAEIMASNRAKYCTGVVFKAQYKPSNITTSDGTFYWYDNKAFASLDDVKKYSTTVNDITNLSDENCAQYGILKYEEGICYYTYWIRHADDGDPTKISPMEYAIVRNNIYQVEVASITTIGSPEPEDEVNAAIKVYVVNWDATSIKTEDVVWGDPIPSN